jgi:hypothetical protein
MWGFQTLQKIREPPLLPALCYILPNPTSFSAWPPPRHGILPNLTSSLTWHPPQPDILTNSTFYPTNQSHCWMCQLCIPKLNGNSEHETLIQVPHSQQPTQPYIHPIPTSFPTQYPSQPKILLNLKLSRNKLSTQPNILPNPTSSQTWHHPKPGIIPNLTSSLCWHHHHPDIITNVTSSPTWHHPQTHNIPYPTSSPIPLPHKDLGFSRF